MLSLLLLFALLACSVFGTVAAQAETPSAHAPPLDLWLLARANPAHRFSTLFTAQDVRDRLNSEDGLRDAVEWCKRTAVTKVYIESYRDGYQAERAVLIKAKDRFTQSGFLVSGCVTPTGIGKQSSGWKVVSCYSDRATQDQVQSIFEFTAGIFDEIMIDDFWFTDCTCPECETGRKSKAAVVGGKAYAVEGDTWEKYRCELMARLSRDRVLAPAKKVNPKASLIIKYPQWYDNFHERGYEILRQTADFDTIWVGTESRDYNDPRWGGTVQYESYFIMRWLGAVGGAKCGGGWYDWLGTTEKTYVEQARQTILGGARESILFCYGGLQGTTGPKNIEALRKNLPELLSVANEVLPRRAVGVAAYKPANSHPENEKRVFDFVGMLGVPMAPCHEFPTNAPSAFFSMHALKDADFVPKLTRFLAAGKPVLLTDGLAQKLNGKMDLANARVIAVKGDPKSLLTLPTTELASLREPLLRPLRTTFEAPAKVALYLFADGSWVIENFNDEAVTVRFHGKDLELDARGWRYQWRK